MHAEILRDEHNRPCELSESELDHISGGLAFLGAVAEGVVLGFAIIGTAAVVGGVAYYAATGKNPVHLLGI
jgi:bacteriocin-like protein